MNLRRNKNHITNIAQISAAGIDSDLVNLFYQACPKISGTSYCLFDFRIFQPIHARISNAIQFPSGAAIVIDTMEKHAALNSLMEQASVTSRMDSLAKQEGKTITQNLVMLIDDRVNSEELVVQEDPINDEEEEESDGWFQDVYRGSKTGWPVLLYEGEPHKN